jgi:hypothetical protein
LTKWIRNGNDDDHAHSLPALIPIPKAFDGNSQVSSYTGQNIIFNLKRDMVLSDIGYTPQHAVPLYVRSTLMEIEGSSINGDPTQVELAADRRYSHYVGRPFVRFKEPTTPSYQAEKPTSNFSGATRLSPLVNDLSALKDFDMVSNAHKSFKTLAKSSTGEYFPQD